MRGKKEERGQERRRREGDREKGTRLVTVWDGLHSSCVPKVIDAGVQKSDTPGDIYFPVCSIT